ncbi:MAG: hypothetical protein DI562_01960 [Stenotrophomonas acidaminiphila]|nr:MAG: hypothetical protein DI562_01960 [Stenotrophomonas acidaminiphila]
MDHAAFDWVAGNELRDLLDEQVRIGTRSTVAKLKFLHGAHTLGNVQRITRGVEDLINVDLVAMAVPELRKALDVGVADTNEPLLACIDRHFDPGVSMRIAELLAHISLLRSFIATYQRSIDSRFSHLRSATDLAHYLKSRRRHLNTLFYTVSDVSRGDIRLSIDELYFLVFDTIERSFVSGLTSLHNKQTMLAVFPDYGCQRLGDGLMDRDPRSARLLDDQYLEAERLSITELETPSEPDDSFDRRKIISAPELRARLRQIEVAYAPYELAERGFGDLRRFAEEVMAFAKDDYYLRIANDAFMDIAQRYPHSPWMSSVLYRPDPHYPLHGSEAAFAEHAGIFYSDLMMFMRFAYRIRDRLLEQNQRYRIKSGFIFESTLLDQLTVLGFEDQKIKRIDHREFDVVVRRDDVIYNFQCKNVRLDHSLMETNLPQFVRNNKRIVRYFQRALVKERQREALLMRETGAQIIEHYVVSRFPVFTDDQRILSLRDVPEFFS